MQTFVYIEICKRLVTPTRFFLVVQAELVTFLCLVVNIQNSFLLDKHGDATMATTF